MDPYSAHVVIVGGPEDDEELLAIVLDDGDAIPLFDSVEEAWEFLASLGDFGDDWVPIEVSARELISLLEFQDDEVEHVALSPPPERLTGGMEVNLIPRAALVMLLERQAEASTTGEDEPGESPGFWRRLFGR
jgi:hypothetical protein